MRPRRRITPYLLVAPALALFTFAVLGPIVVTGVFSFFEWDGFGSFDPVGVANYLRAAADPLFRASFLHVAIYIALTIVLEVFVGLVLAGLVTARPRGTGVFRVAFFIPVMLPMVVVAVLWDFVYNPDFGLLNSALTAVGLEEFTQIWLGDTRFALIAVSVVSGWVFAGFYMAIFYAGFRGIPGDVLEAARIDGASEIQTFWRVKVPMIRHVIEIALLLCITGGFQAFDLFYVLTNGGPFNATEIPTTYLVRVVFRNQEIGYGSAMAVVMTLVVLAIGGIYVRLRRRTAVETMS
ncbi:MAG TPA: sugar ABC transporter permease [Acidimicrobiia bacterium]|nr:sugar ABC transporter permease [Acidimicrobiia bacterium]